MERYGLEVSEYPPVNVLIVKGHEDLTIRIDDRGGKIDSTYYLIHIFRLCFRSISFLLSRRV